MPKLYDRGLFGVAKEYSSPPPPVPHARVRLGEAAGVDPGMTGTWFGGV